MALTPTYSWPLPDNTDLVKDGAEAIRDLGNAIDTTVSGLGSGLVHIETQTFSAVSSFSFSNDVFTSDYDNYRVVMYFTSSGNTAITWRGRIAGVDTTASNFNVQLFIAFGSSVSATRSTSQTQARFTQGDDESGSCAATMDLFTPKLALSTRYLSHGWSSDQQATMEIASGAYVLTTSFDSLTILSPGANITGEASLYGYDK